MYKKILVPLDGSKLGECCLEHVRNVAIGCQVPAVVLLSVVESRGRTGAAPPESSKGADEGTSLWAEKYLDGIVAKLKDEGIAATRAVAFGQAGDEIANYVARNAVDLIIMSSHGRSGVSRWAFGSVTDKVVRASPAPVLVAPVPGCRKKALK